MADKEAAEAGVTLPEKTELKMRCSAIMASRSPAPWFLKHRRSCLIAIGLMMLPAYLASYPVAYRVLVGSDENSGASVPHWMGCCICPPPTPEAVRRWEVWCKLSRYYFPPAEWMIDHTPVQQPVLLVAHVMDVDSQMEGNVAGRAFRRRFDAAWRTGNQALIEAELDREMAEIDTRMRSADESEE